jgi:ribosomal-protein-alanine N-acetyltransferase
MTRRLRAIAADDLATLAHLHGLCFPEDHWDEKALAELLRMSGASGHLVADDTLICGFILDVMMIGEAEVLTLAVAPKARRQGIARLLLEDLFLRARQGGAGNIGLEVAADNAAARRLYQSCGFLQTGRRRGYYRRRGGLVDALLFRRALANGPLTAT